MNNSRFMALLMAVILVAGMGAEAEEAASPVEQYKQERLGKPAYERFLYAQEILVQSQDAAVLHEAVQDVVRYAANRDEDEAALRAIEAAIPRLPPDGDAYREAVLARGKMLTRLGRREEAETLFQEAIQKQWKHALWRYSESLIENDAMAEACRLEWERIAGIETYRHYRGEEESLEIFLTLLRLMKHGKPDSLAAVEVSHKLENHTDRPEYVKIARALCMAEDGYIPEALALLNELDRELSETKTHREYKHIPLYQASILFKEGRDYPPAEAAFLEFIARNEGKDSKIIASALRLARDIEIQKKNYHKMDEFASFIISSDWFQKESVQSGFSADDIASIYDMLQIGLMNSGKENESLKICNYVKKTFPGTLAAANCTRTIIDTLPIKNNMLEIINQYNQILNSTDDDTLTAIIHYKLARIARISRDYYKALQHIQESRRRISIRAKGVMSDIRKACDYLYESLASN